MIDVVGPPQSCKVYTPRKLAAAMVDALWTPAQQTWLEPSCGQGVFLEVLRSAGVDKEFVRAVDLVARPSANDAFAKVKRGVDFLEWSSRTRMRFDCVVGNPPFLSIRTLKEPLQSRAASVSDNEGCAIGIRANTWYAFLLCSIKLLKPGGKLAFVLPAACEYADYCRRGREGITNQFERIDLIRSRRPLFKGVHEGSVILVLRNKSGEGGLFRRHEVSSREKVIRRLGHLKGTKARKCPLQTRRHSQETTRLGDVMRVRLGGVTGDAKFFVFSEDHRKAHGLPISAVRPVVARSRHTQFPELGTDHWRMLREEGERVWLFDPPPYATRHPAVQQYLRLTPENGGCNRNRYKIAHRDIWYRTPLPQTPHGFISGMSSSGVWVCMNAMPTLNATNTLYVVHFDKLMSRCRRYAWALSLLTTPATKAFSLLTRVYADGLKKIEPGQLANVRLPNPQSIRNSVSLYREAVAHLLRGDTKTSQAIADQAVFGAQGQWAALDQENCLLME